MDFGPVFFFVFLAAIIIVPQVLRNQERQRLHDTIRACLAKGQPVPPELWQSLRWRRRVYTADYGAGVYSADYGYGPQAYAAPTGQAAASAAPLGATAAVGDAPSGEPPRFEPGADAMAPPVFVGRSLSERDLRRGVTWVAIGLGLIAAGAAFYAGLYYDGGAPEVFSSFAALGAIPLFVGLTYLALWFFSRKGKA